MTEDDFPKKRTIKIMNCPHVPIAGLESAFGGPDAGIVSGEVNKQSQEAFIVFKTERDAREAETQFDGGEINGKVIRIYMVE